ncbi:hypothetical protein AZ018_002224, partial [Klebsiella pneumoniae]
YSIFCPTGKDEKLRPRFDSSEARERCRRQWPEGRGALAPSNPSPTTCCTLSHLFCCLIARASLSEATSGAVW